MKSQNIFSKTHKNLEKEEIYELLVKNDAVMIEKIITKGHQESPGSDWYDQEKNEWVMVLKGKAVLSFEDQSLVQLNEGDFVNIPAHKKHRVASTDPNNETIWLAVHYR